MKAEAGGGTLLSVLQQRNVCAVIQQRVTLNVLKLAVWKQLDVSAPLSDSEPLANNQTETGNQLLTF